MIGQALSQELSQAVLNSNHELYFLGRDRSKIIKKFGADFKIMTWDELSQNQNLLDPIDLIINLSGENIGEQKWSEKQKEKIIKSRVESTLLLAKFCAARASEKENKKIRLLNASAIGIYEGENLHDENAEISLTPKTFLSQVAQAWERALEPAEKAGVPVTRMRFSVVLSDQGGALGKMLPAFRFGLGGILGSGKQLFSWISLHDLVRAIIFLIDHPEITGPVNMVSPEVITQKVFAKTLAKIINRPCFLKIPEWVLKIQFGEMAQELLLSGLCVKSKRLDQHGFIFEDKDLKTALQRIFIKK